MTTTTKTRSALDAEVPRSGRAADAYEVASTAATLRAIVEHNAALPAASDGRYATARHAVTLHRISGRLHRIAERECNGVPGYDCPKCKGDGWGCEKCGGTGDAPATLRLRRQAREIAEHYGCRAYFQGDPRGCALYLVPESLLPATLADVPDYLKGYASDADKPPTLEQYRERWIGANYNRGHAVTRLGR